MSTATAVNDCSLYRIEKALMLRMLHEEHELSELFVAHLLSRNIRYEADLVDQLFNSSEKRLARILLLLAHFGKESRAETVLPGISQANLAQMVGTTRSRVSHFMNKFREGMHLEFRAEFFNAFNMVNFANPYSSILSGYPYTLQSTGKITSTSAGPRVIQFALKYSF